MKQSELDKQLKLVAKTQAKERSWKSVAGVPYWQSGPLFFVLVLSASVKQRSFFASLRFKWLALDSMLWRVLGMEGNEKKPFSLHANGAFALMGTELLSCHEKVCAWESGALEAETYRVMQLAHDCASETANSVSTLDGYLGFIKAKHAALMERHPRAVVTTWPEQLLAAMVADDAQLAKDIAQARIAARDSGGYMSRGLSLYQRALALLELPPNSSSKPTPLRGAA